MLEVSQWDLCVSSMCLYDIRGPWWLLGDDMTSLMRKGPSQDHTHKCLMALLCWWLTLFMAFVTGNTHSKHQTYMNHQTSGQQYLHLLSFLILSTPARRLTNGEAAGNKVGAAQSFPPSVIWITIKLMYQCLKVELRYDSRMINGSVYCLI